jgi:ribA/ribD-fused uncharacterized protein
MTGFTSIDKNMKMSQTDTHVFFLNGPFSQWYPSNFETFIFSEDATILNFNCAEQYMMAAKAKLFKDEEIFEQIMATKQDPSNWTSAPRIHKALGREIKNFDEKVWTTYARPMVEKGNFAKFDQNPKLRDFLFQFEDKILVEGAHYDKIWGVGLAWDDPRIIDPANWKGMNWLGESLMKVRKLLVD